jgi:hypothetical protein
MGPILPSVSGRDRLGGLCPCGPAINPNDRRAGAGAQDPPQQSSCAPIFIAMHASGAGHAEQLCGRLSAYSNADTVRYLGIEVDDALTIAEQIDL